MKKLFLFFLILLIPLFLPKNIVAQSSYPPCTGPSDTSCPPGTTCQSSPYGYFCAPTSGSTTCTPEFGSSGVPTGLGCIPTQPEGLVKWILKYAILLGGGIAFILSLWGGITIILAGGNPEKINEGKEIISSAITGILFIIFSVFLLRFIGLDILQLPGFAK